MVSNVWRLVMATLLVSQALAGITCPPVDEERDPALEELHYYSDIVVMGKVTERYPTSPSGGGDGGGDGSDGTPKPEVYTAELEVYCVYKGNPVPARINITNAGNPPNMCFSSDFEVGLSYVVYLKKIGNGKLIPAYAPHPEAYKDELIFICNVTISLPVGLRELPDGVKCEDKLEYDYGDYYDYGDEGKGNATCFSYKPKEDETYKTEGSRSGGDGEVNDSGNGNEPLCLSLLLLALSHGVIWVFS
ncbi:hypothetical protein ACOMHN_026110 [Nucella lapillus]